MIWPSKFTGNSVVEQWLNRLLDCCKASKPISSALIRASEGPNGTTLTPLAVGSGKSAAVGILTLSYVSMFADYFIAEDEDGTAYQVAKIPEIRCGEIGAQVIYGVRYNYGYPNNPAGGGPVAVASQSYVTRKQTLASDPTQFDNQEVTPPFCAESGGVPADTLIAISMPDGTGVMSDPLDPNTPGYKAGPPIVPGTPTELTWLHFSTAKAWTSLQNQTTF